MKLYKIYSGEGIFIPSTSQAMPVLNEKTGVWDLQDPHDVVMVKVSDTHAAKATYVSKDGKMGFVKDETISEETTPATE